MGATAFLLEKMGPGMQKSEHEVNICLPIEKWTKSTKFIKASSLCDGHRRKRELMYYAGNHHENTPI